MDIETRQELRRRIDQFNKNNNTKIDSLEFVQKVLSPIEAANNNEDFNKEYVYSYQRYLKQVYKNFIDSCSNITISKDEEDESKAYATYYTKETVYEKGLNLIKEFDYLFASLTKYTLSKVERKEKADPSAKDLIFAGLKPENILGMLDDSITSNTPKVDFETKNDLTEDQKCAEGMKIIADIASLQKGKPAENKVIGYIEKEKQDIYYTDLAIGELEKKAAAVYLSMREAHRKHNILWKIFKGGESRQRLKEYKQAFCKAMNVSEKNATEHMKVVAEGNSMTMEKAISTDFVNDLIREKACNSFKEQSEQEYERITDNYLSENKDVKDNLTLDDEDIKSEDEKEIQKFEENTLNESEEMSIEKK